MFDGVICAVRVSIAFLECVTYIVLETAWLWGFLFGGVVGSLSKLLR